MTTYAGRTADGSRDGQDVASLFQGKIRRYEGPAPPRRFDNDNSGGQTADDALSRRKIHRLRLGIGRLLGHYRSGLRDFPGQTRCSAG